MKYDEIIRWEYNFIVRSALSNERAPWYLLPCNCYFLLDGRKPCGLKWVIQPSWHWPPQLKKILYRFFFGLLIAVDNCGNWKPLEKQHAPQVIIPPKSKNTWPGGGVSLGLTTNNDMCFIFSILFIIPGYQGDPWWNPPNRKNVRVGLYLGGGWFVFVYLQRWLPHY